MGPWARLGLPAGSPFLLARLLLAAALAAPLYASADVPLDGVRRVVLHARDGTSLPIGSVSFAPRPDGRSDFVLTMDRTHFVDHFLSMREFKCVPAPSEILCHVPYPYANPAHVTRDDPAWLEHALLFMFKRPSEFGAKLWNGVYFRLRPTPSGFEGLPQAVDLNRIAAPAANPDIPPFKPALRDDMPAGVRWFGRMTIE
jgi:hypothetical protein